MYEHTFPEGQVERERANRLGRAGIARREGDSALDPALSRTLASVMDKMTGVLEGQAVYRREIAALREDAAGLRAELARTAEEHRRELDAVRGAHEKRMRAMQDEASALRAENERLQEYIRRRIEKDNPLHSKPGAAFLGLPLVIGNERGEFLGVADRGRGHFTTLNLLSLIQSSQRAGRAVDVAWDRDREHWILRVCVREAGREQHLVLMLLQTLTPNRNLVAQLTHLIVDGHEVPERFLLSLFRQIRESFNS